MTSSKNKRSLTGIQPSGEVHLGNYLGMIKPALERQKEYQCLYFIADMHALTTTKNASSIESNVLDLVATWLALGLDINKHLLYRQSDIPMVAEFAWYLSCVTGMGLLEKGHAYKDAQAQSKELNHGVFAYPVLMAADILMYDADIVPVGKDQKQHVEMARDIAGSFNAAYQANVIKLPEVKIEERVMVIPGLDGRKMSKSYGNHIPIFCDEKTLKQKIMSIKTDSTPLEAPKELKGTLVGDLFSLFASLAQCKDLETRLNKGGLGWGHAKEELFQIINSAIAETRARYADLRKDEKSLLKTLEIGAHKAFEISLPVINRVRNAVGFNTFPFRMG